MTISLKIINKDEQTTRSVLIDQQENGSPAGCIVLPAGGEATFTIHSTKSLKITELQHTEDAPKEGWTGLMEPEATKADVETMPQASLSSGATGAIEKDEETAELSAE